MELAFKEPIYIEQESIAYAVFGREKEDKSVALHFKNLLKERSQLHVRHMNDIRHRWNCSIP